MHTPLRVIRSLTYNLHTKSQKTGELCRSATVVWRMFLLSPQEALSTTNDLCAAGWTLYTVLAGRGLHKTIT